MKPDFSIQRIVYALKVHRLSIDHSARDIIILSFDVFVYRSSRKFVYKWRRKKKKKITITVLRLSVLFWARTRTRRRETRGGEKKSGSRLATGDNSPGDNSPGFKLKRHRDPTAITSTPLSGDDLFGETSPSSSCNNNCCIMIIIWR